MPSIIDDFANIRARVDQLNGKAYEPGYKAPQPHQSPDPDQHWATGGVVSGRLSANPNLNANFGATKRPANEVIGDFARTMYGLIGQYGAFPIPDAHPSMQQILKSRSATYASLVTYFMPAC